MLCFWNALLGNSFSKQGRTLLCQATSSKRNINQLALLSFPEICESLFREKSSFYLLVLIQRHRDFDHHIIKLNFKPFPSLATAFIKSQKSSPKPQSNQTKPPNGKLEQKLQLSLYSVQSHLSKILTFLVKRSNQIKLCPFFPLHGAARRKFQSLLVLLQHRYNLQ